MTNRINPFCLFLVCAVAATELHAQVPTMPNAVTPPTPGVTSTSGSATNTAAALTNLPPSTPPLAATNAITLSNYKHPLTDVRRINRLTEPTNSLDRHFDW